MKRSRKVKSILLAAGLSLCLSVPITANAGAYVPGLTDYKAVSGDSLFKISRVFHTTVDHLMKINGLTDTSLNVGQVLKVPGDTYTVIKGDTLYLIAQKYKMPLSSLSRANNIYGDYLDIGQRLAVPGAGSAAVPGTGSTPSYVPAEPAQPAPPISEELDLLSRLIMAEAQGESYQAKVAVGAVVMNRVKSGLFADTVKGVIYQNINGYYQFTPVVNGWINKPANADSIRAAKDALNGSDPTAGALWYYDTSTTNPFMLSKKIALKTGNMVFAY